MSDASKINETTATSLSAEEHARILKIENDRVREIQSAALIKKNFEDKTDRLNGESTGHLVAVGADLGSIGMNLAKMKPKELGQHVIKLGVDTFKYLMKEFEKASHASTYTSAIVSAPKENLNTSQESDNTSQNRPDSKGQTVQAYKGPTIVGQAPALTA